MVREAEGDYKEAWGNFQSEGNTPYLDGESGYANVCIQLHTCVDHLCVKYTPASNYI